MSWREAHRIAMVAATHAHDELGIERDQRIPVFQAVEDLGIVLTFQPMPRLSGALFRSEGVRPGILVNTHHPIGRQRYTAAHELGHYWFGHETTLDEESPEELRSGSPADSEKMAEAFASWFLMPRPLVRRTLGKLGLSNVSSPRDAYTLSLVIGASYRATVRHLGDLNAINSSQRDAWLRVQPAALKRELAGGHPLANSRNDVWVAEEPQNGLEIFPRPGDRLVVTLPEIPSTGFSWQLVDTSGWVLVADEDLPLATQTEVDATPPGSMALRRYSLTLHSDTAAPKLEFHLKPSWLSDATEKPFGVKVTPEPVRHGMSEKWFVAA